MANFELVFPKAEHLPSYIHALEQGWSPDNLRPEASAEQLAEIHRDPVAFATEPSHRRCRHEPESPNGIQVFVIGVECRCTVP